MTADMWLRNLAACGLQAVILVFAGSLLARLFRIEQPRAALAYWRVLLVACLALPFSQPWRAVAAPHVSLGATAARVTNVAVTMPTHGAATSSAWSSLEGLTTMVLCGGILLRGVWLEA